MSCAAVRCHLKACQKKGFATGANGIWTTTSAWSTYKGGVEVGVEVVAHKNIHNNEFTLDIKRMPQQWYEGHYFFQSLRSVRFFWNQSTKTLTLEYDKCKVQIFALKKKITFWVKEQTGATFDECQSKAFDTFVEYYDLISSNGFVLDYKIRSRDAHFADPNGFLAQLATKHTQDNYIVETTKGTFWIDRSKGVPEIESDKIEIAQRIESFGESIVETGLTMHDVSTMDDRLNKLLTATERLSVSQSQLIKNMEILVSSQNVTVGQISTLIKIQMPERPAPIDLGKPDYMG